MLLNKVLLKISSILIALQCVLIFIMSYFVFNGYYFTSTISILYIFLLMPQNLKNLGILYSPIVNSKLFLYFINLLMVISIFLTINLVNDYLVVSASSLCFMLSTYRLIIYLYLHRSKLVTF